MNAIYDFRTVKSVPAKLPPVKVGPPAAWDEATLAAMKAEADRWRRRKAEAWGERMSVGDNPTSHNQVTFWTIEAEAQFQANILAALHRNGPMTVPKILDCVPKPRSRNKLREMLIELRKAGKVTVQDGKRKEWSAV